MFIKESVLQHIFSIASVNALKNLMSHWQLHFTDENRVSGNADFFRLKEQKDRTSANTHRG